MRPEVEEAISYGCTEPGTCRDRLCRDERQRLLALIELGVRLGLADAANHLRLHSNPGHADFLLERVTVASVLEGK